MTNITRVRQLHERALRVAQAYLGAEAELIEILQGLDETKGYRHYGAKSLFDYATSVLKLSTATTFNLTTVARKSREVPALKEAIRAGTLTLSKARKTVPVLTLANQARWIGLAQTLTSRELEREVAKARTERDGSRFVAGPDDRRGHRPREDHEERVVDEDGLAPEPKLQLQLEVARGVVRKLERSKALLSHERSESMSLELTFEALLDFYLEKNDPLWRPPTAPKKVAPTVPIALAPMARKLEPLVWRNGRR